MSCWWRWRHIPKWAAGTECEKLKVRHFFKKWKDGSIKECARLTNSFIHTVFYFHVQNLHPFTFPVLSREYAVVSNAASCAVRLSASPATASHHLFIQAHRVTITAVFTITKHPTKWAETSPSFYQLSILWSPFDVILVKLLSGFGHGFYLEVGFKIIYSYLWRCSLTWRWVCSPNGQGRWVLKGNFFLPLSQSAYL